MHPASKYQNLSVHLPYILGFRLSHRKNYKLLLITARFLLISSIRVFPAGLHALWLILLLFAFSSSAAAQATGSNEPEGLVRSVKFDGNDAISNGVLQTVVRTRTNREIFSIPGATLWLGLNRISSRLGEAPRMINTATIAQDVERLRIFYNNNGYLEASVTSEVRELRGNRWQVIFRIDEGEPSVMRTVSFSGIPEFDDPRVMERFFSRSQLIRENEPVNDSTYVSNRIYSVDLISEERNRILTMLHNNGYASASRDSIVVQVRRDSENPLNLDLAFRVQPGRVFYFGDVRINLSAPQSVAGDFVSDTLSGPPVTFEPWRMIINIEPDARTRARLLEQRVLFTPGERFNNQLYLSTVNQFQTLGMLSLRQFSLSEAGGLPDFRSEHLPIFFDLETLPRHQIRADFFGMQRIGLGLGAGLQYSNNNIFGSAERFELGLNTSYEFIEGNQENPRSIETFVNYSFPRFAFPFAAFNNDTRFLNPRTRFQLSYGQIRQINFTVDDNVRFSMRFQANHDRTTTSLLDLLELEWFDANITPAFREVLEETTTDPLFLQLILEDYRPQINSLTRYTFRNAATHPIRRDRGFFLETSLELGGNLPRLIEETLFERPDSLRGTFPSLSGSGRDLSYSQFIKGSLDYRRYYAIGNNSVFAWRGFVGLAYPYGLSRTIPLNRRFFAGGSNDIRGWNPLTLGPGTNDRNLNPINGGDIKLAGYLEFRNTFSRNFLNTNWIFAAFTDFGNVWTGPRNELDEGKFSFNTFWSEIAVGSGIGLRLDWEFVVFRIDFAYRVTDLGNEPGTSILDRRNIHFGIGHSF